MTRDAHRKLTTPWSNHGACRGQRLWLWMGVWVACALLVPPPAHAAEIRGTVQVVGSGLFKHSPGARLEGGISVAALPLQGQVLPPPVIETRRIVIDHRKFDPVFLTLPRGDSVLFINRDDIYHEPFSLSRIMPFDFTLAKSGSAPGQTEHVVQFLKTGIWHIFCRIHHRMYARIDVVDTPYIRLLDDGGSFDFKGLAPGRWRLRIAAPGSKVMEVDTEAITEPPPLHIRLPVSGDTRAVGAGTGNSTMIKRLYPDR